MLVWPVAVMMQPVAVLLQPVAVLVHPVAGREQLRTHRLRRVVKGGALIRTPVS